MADNRLFMANVRKFADLSADKMLRVAKQSVQEVVEIAQTPVGKGGNMPVDTGFLRNSLVTELDGAQVAEGADSYTLGISAMELGDTLRFAWTAEYALPRHYMVGVGQGGGLWRDNAANQWQAIVRRNTRKVQT